MNQWALCCLSQGKALLSATFARYVFSWPLLLQVASTLSRFSCSCERLPLSRLFSQLPLLSVISSLLAIFRSSLPENIFLIWDWFILVSTATFCRATKNDFVPDAEDHKPGTHLLLAKAGGLRRRDFMLQREALVSLAVFGFCRLSETFHFIVSTTVLAKTHAIFIKEPLKLFPSWFWLLVLTLTHNHTTTQPHNRTTAQTHKHTNTQPHNHTTTQPHNHTTTQPHNHTTTQPHNRTTAQPHNRTTAQTHKFTFKPHHLRKLPNHICKLSFAKSGVGSPASTMRARSSSQVHGILPHPDVTSRHICLRIRIGFLVHFIRNCKQNLLQSGGKLIPHGINRWLVNLMRKRGPRQLIPGIFNFLLPNGFSTKVRALKCPGHTKNCSVTVLMSLLPCNTKI